MAFKDKEKKLFLSSLRNNASEHKLLTSLLFLCIIATLLLFIPSSSFTISASDLRFCISRISQTPPTPSPPPPPPPPSPASTILHEKLILNNNNTNIIKRFFHPYGSAAYNFITMSAYRGGLNTFAIIGLSSKPLHVYGNPTYQCEWIPNIRTNTNSSVEKITTIGYKILPDWGYGRVYTAVVVNCTFNETINVNNNGGKLNLYASTSGGGDTNYNITDKMEVLVEQPKMAMSVKVCLSDDYGKTYRKWGFEKLVYKDAITGIRRDRKYCVQPRNLYATGIHMSENLVGKTTHNTEGRIKYFHYHGSIAARRETCKILVNKTNVNYEKTPYVLDTTLRDIAGVIKKFELKMIGSRLQKTRQ
ncbi:unnamed protein product [Trifolium pratense]|uniref:Uncharacterized protein n=1 Tax=Trifolium pratense TaxID=57577 RepID=A0ACB0IW77_TRIPR|nr:unnamed protein product [Trifolium pratense]